MPFYNTSSHQIITRDQIESGVTDWMVFFQVLSEMMARAFPAYYNKQSHGVLDNTQGDVENDWIHPVGYGNLSFTMGPLRYEIQKGEMKSCGQPQFF